MLIIESFYILAIWNVKLSHTDEFCKTFVSGHESISELWHVLWWCSQVTRVSFITWSWILGSSGISRHAFGRTRISTRKIRAVRVWWFTGLSGLRCWSEISAGMASWRCSHLPMEASHAFTPTCEWPSFWLG